MFFKKLSVSAAFNDLPPPHCVDGGGGFKISNGKVRLVHISGKHLFSKTKIFDRKSFGV